MVLARARGPDRLSVGVCGADRLHSVAARYGTGPGGATAVSGGPAGAGGDLAIGAARCPALLWALATVAVTLVLGRVFCGWVCPLGTLHAIVSRLLRRRGRRPPQAAVPTAPGRRLASTGSAPVPGWTAHRVKYYLLAGLLAMALVGGHWGTIFDPLVLLYRTDDRGPFPGGPVGGGRGLDGHLSAPAGPRTVSAGDRDRAGLRFPASARIHGAEAGLSGQRRWSRGCSSLRWR